MKEKKKVLLILGVLIGVLSVVGISYALWQLSLIQTGTNVVTTGCFQVEFTDQNPITLTNAYPISEEEGMTLTPYEFTITNTCDSEASYQINLEVLNDSTFTELGYIRETLNEKEGTSSSKILTSNEEVENTLDNASSAYKLSNGVLAGKESKTFEFRLWIDQDTPAIESVMEKTLNSRITVITSYKAPVDTTNMMVAMDVTFNNNAVWPDNINNTYTQNGKYYNLKKIEYQSIVNPYENALEVVDFSVNQDRSVLGYYVLNEKEQESEGDSYTLYIQADGKIKINPIASYYYFIACSGHYVCDPTNYLILGIENWDTSEVVDMSSMFYSYNSVDHLDLSNFDTSKVTNMRYMFEEMSDLTNLNLSSFDTSKVTDMSGMFNGVSSLTSLDLSSFDTSNVTNMSDMFSYMSSLTSLDISSFDTLNVTNMSGMFHMLSRLTSLDLSHFDTSNVTDMRAMFYGMRNLTLLDISSFDTSNVTSMSTMFYLLSSLTSLDVSNFDTSNVTSMRNIFGSMSSLTSLDLSSFDTSNVTDMGYMFSDDSSLMNITYGDHFIRKPNSQIDSMFQNCPANKPTHSSWNGVTW